MMLSNNREAGVSDPALKDEMAMLVRSIVGFPTGEGGDHATTLDALGEFLVWFPSDEIPWVRLYEIFPAWQQRSRLLQQDWDKVAMEGATVVFTLVNARPGGAFISRTARGGGTWKSTGGDTIGNKVVLSKLYLRMGNGYRNGFTAFEFRLSSDVQPHPRVALCVLHRTDYRHCARDLKQYAHLKCSLGRFSPNPQVVPPSYQDPYFSPCMNGPLFDTNNLASNSGISCDQPSIHPSRFLDEEPSLLWFSGNNSMTELAGQHSYVDKMPIQNYGDNNLFGNNNNYAYPPIQDAMLHSFEQPYHGQTNDNEPSLEPLPRPWDGYSTATADDHTQDGH